jgi:ech hydrogenase subunit A
MPPAVAMTGALAVLLLLAGPLTGAAALAAGGRDTERRDRELVALAALGATLIGLIIGLLSWGVIGRGGLIRLDLGPLDPHSAAGGLAWSLAPPGIGILFLAIAIRSKSALLVCLAAAQLVVAAIPVAEDVAGYRPAETAVGGGLVVDPLAATLLAVSVVVGGLITVYALGYEPDHLAHRGLPTGRTSTFVAWLLVFVSAMNLLVLADDLRLLAVGWEITTLCSFALIGFDGDPAGRIAARRALAYNLAGGIALGSATLLAGPGATLSGLVGGQPAGVVLPFVLVGCIVAAAAKSALVPFHPWLLGAMVAAAPVSALLHASAMVKAGSYLLLRLAPPIAADGLIGPALTLLGGGTFATAALAALRQRDLKRILAFSTISTLGLIAAAAGLGSAAAVSAGVLLLVFHAVAKALAFLSVGAIEQVGRTRDVEALVGALRTVPLLAGPLAIAAAALALPPFGLVVAKWALLELGARDVLLIVLLAVGGAAYLVVWTGVVGRLLVRRAVTTVSQAGARALPMRERLPIALLALASTAGLVAAAPVARAVADPAGFAAFRVDPRLASGWSIALDAGRFAVPAVVLLGGVAAVAALVVGRRIRTIAPAPYLSGAGVAGAPPTSFHGGMGRPIEAHSGGFYWGGESGGEVGGAADGASLAPGGPAGAVGRWMTRAGWLLVGLVVLAAAASALGWGAGP